MNTAPAAGRALSNWNDSRARHDRRAEAPRLWRAIDRVAGWLYTRGKK